MSGFKNTHEKWIQELTYECFGASAAKVVILSPGWAEAGSGPIRSEPHRSAQSRSEPHRAAQSRTVPHRAVRSELFEETLRRNCSIKLCSVSQTLCFLVLCIP